MTSIYPQHAKAEALQPEFAMLRGFLDFLLDHHAMAAIQDNPQMGLTTVPTPEKTNNVSMDRNVCAFLGIDYEAYMAETEEIERRESVPAGELCSA